MSITPSTMSWKHLNNNMTVKLFDNIMNCGNRDFKNLRGGQTIALTKISNSSRQTQDNFKHKNKLSTHNMNFVGKIPCIISISQ